jgi:hypothetical protein
MYVETMFIVGTAGLAGPLLADDGSVDISIPDAIPLLGGYEISFTESASLGVFNISTTGESSFGVASLGLSMDVTIQDPDVITYGHASIGIGRNIGV